MISGKKAETKGNNDSGESILKNVSRVKKINGNYLNYTMYAAPSRAHHIPSLFLTSLALWDVGPAYRAYLSYLFPFFEGCIFIICTTLPPYTVLEYFLQINTHFHAKQCTTAFNRDMFFHIRICTCTYHTVNPSKLTAVCMFQEFQATNNLQREDKMINTSIINIILLVSGAFVSITFELPTLTGP